MFTRTGVRCVVYPFNVIITKYTFIKPVRKVKKQTKTSIKQLFKTVKKQLTKQK